MTKKIIVFADGTGSAFGAQESNVWRLYQALDRLTPDQIAQYIKGVGTSGVKIFALIDGATGIGVPSNVRKLYRFLCWNWDEGDEIYMFGFSRGAFTIRTLIGLIDKEGLVPRYIGDFKGAKRQAHAARVGLVAHNINDIKRRLVSQAEMQRNAMLAWRSYRQKSVPWHKSLPTIWVARLIRDAVLTAYHAFLRHRSYSEVQAEVSAQNRRNVPIKFVGLFDTVEAYGVPIDELRKAIDWAIWPTSFRNRTLSKNVEYMRHALSLDDERTTFHPIRFDMTKESTDRIHEVWFAGVHLDVGGGYPDASLAYVPLVWMAEEAQREKIDADGRRTPGLRFAAGALDDFRCNASALGPMHDSRTGFAVLYRYDPRHIDDDEASGRPPVVHHSVVEKMVFGSENYAPITLPSSANVLLPDGTKHAIKGFSVKEARPTAARADLQMDPALYAVEALRAPNAELAALTLDTVWWRRVAYFALLGAVLLAASLPVTAYWLTSAFKSSVGSLCSLIGLEHECQSIWEGLVSANEGVGTNFHSISKTVGGFLPGYVKYWIEVAVTRPITSGVVFGFVLLLYWTNAYLRERIRDRARLAWFFEGRKVQQGLENPGLLMKLAGRLRESAAGRGLYLATARFVLPGLALVAIFSVAAVTVSRTTVSYRTGGGDFCQEGRNEPLVAASETQREATSSFEVDSLCWASGIGVEKGHHYLLWITMNHPFFDQTIMTDIAGFRDSSLRHLIGLPIRRWWGADWFQPIARIGQKGDVEWPLVAFDGSEALELGFDADGKKMPKDGAYGDPGRLGWCDKIPENEYAAAGKAENAPNLRRTYVSEFVAPESGELFFYVNDAIAAVPFGPTISCFYRNNRGSATVVIQEVPVPKLAVRSQSSHN